MTLCALGKYSGGSLPSIFNQQRDENQQHLTIAGVTKCKQSTDVHTKTNMNGQHL